MKVIKEGQGRQPNPAGALPSRLQSKPDSSSLRSPAFTPLRRQETNDQRKGYNAARATGPNAVCQRPSANSTWRPRNHFQPCPGVQAFQARPCSPDAEQPTGRHRSFSPPLASRSLPCSLRGPTNAARSYLRKWPTMSSKSPRFPPHHCQEVHNQRDKHEAGQQPPARLCMNTGASGPHTPSNRQATTGHSA